MLLLFYIPSLIVSETMRDILTPNLFPRRFSTLNFETSLDILNVGKRYSSLGSFVTSWSSQKLPLVTFGLHHSLMYSFLWFHSLDEAAMPNTMREMLVFFLKGCCFIGVLRWGWSSVVRKSGWWWEEGKAFFEGNHMNVWWIWGCRRGRRCRLRGRRMSLVLLWYMKSGGSFLNIWDCCSFCSQWTRMVSWIWVNFHTKR